MRPTKYVTNKIRLTQILYILDIADQRYGCEEYRYLDNAIMSSQDILRYAIGVQLHEDLKPLEPDTVKKGLDKAEKLGYIKPSGVQFTGTIKPIRVADGTGKSYRGVRQRLWYELTEEGKQYLSEQLAILRMVYGDLLDKIGTFPQSDKERFMPNLVYLERGYKHI